MKEFGFWILLVLMNLLGSEAAFAQTEYFVHLQSENGQPFAVRLNGNEYNASQKGYLMIPKVPVGNQTIVVSFPGRSYQDVAFSFVMGNQSQGFSLQLAIDNSWRLFDLVHFTSLKGSIAAESNKLVVNELKDKVNANQVSPSVINNAVMMANAKDAGIQKIFEKATDGGIDQVYVVNNNGESDTIAVFIPLIQQGLPAPTARNNKPSFEKKLFSMISPRWLMYKEEGKLPSRLISNKRDEFVM